MMDLCLFQHNFRWLLSSNCFIFFFAGKKIVSSEILLTPRALT